MSASIRTVAEARARLERLGSRDPDALDARCGMLVRGPLALVLLGAVTVALAAVLLAWTGKPLLLLPLGLGAAFTVQGARGLRAIAVARRGFLRAPRAVTTLCEPPGPTASGSAEAEAP